MNAKKLPPLLAARERIVTTAIAFRKATLARDKAFENADFQSGSGGVKLEAAAHKLSEDEDRREMVHLKAIQDFFTLCAKLGVEPH